jgi:thioredoxin
MDAYVFDTGDGDFEAQVIERSKQVPIVVDFWAPWCGPCRQVGPIVEQIAAMRQGSYKVVKVNIDEEPALAQEYEVQSIPLIGLFRNGRLERASLGADLSSSAWAGAGTRDFECGFSGRSIFPQERIGSWMTRFDSTWPRRHGCVLRSCPNRA